MTRTRTGQTQPGLALLESSDSTTGVIMTGVRALALLGLLLSQVSAGAAAVPAQPAGWSSFTQSFDALAAADGIVGGAIVVVRDGRMVAHHEFGFADRDRGVRITPQTIYHYGSITKTLTAIAIMQLRDRGRLRLDDPITKLCTGAAPGA